MSETVTAWNFILAGIFLGFGGFFGVTRAFSLSAFVGMVGEAVIGGWKDARSKRANTQGKP